MPLTDDQQKQLQKLYYDPQQGLTHSSKLHKKIDGISLAQIKKFIKEQEVGQLYKYSHRKQFYPITAPPHSYQADLIFMKEKHINNGYDTALTLIEITSRRGYCYPMKGKTTQAVVKAYSAFLKVHNLTTDLGSEFKSHTFKAIVTKWKTKHVMADEGDHSKMGLIERFNRTVKALMSKYMTAYKTKKWIDAISDLMVNYNHTVHSSIGYAPADVGAKEGALIRINARAKTRKIDESKNLNVGDKVRVRKKKGLFKKEGRRWSDEIYTIIEDNVKSFKIDDDTDRRHKHYDLVKVTVPPAKNPYKRTIKSTDLETRLDKYRLEQQLNTDDDDDDDDDEEDDEELAPQRPARSRLPKKRFAIDQPMNPELLDKMN
jgi:hypothetical protein